MQPAPLLDLKWLYKIQNNSIGACSCRSTAQCGSTTTKRADFRRCYVCLLRILLHRNGKQKSPSMVCNKLKSQSCEYGNRLLRDITCEENNTNFVCMAPEDFEHALKIIEPITKKKDTYMRDAKTIEERLTHYFKRGEKVLDTKVFWALEYSVQGKKKAHMKLNTMTHICGISRTHRAQWTAKHVIIQAPWPIDPNYTFLHVDVGCPGRISDGGAFKNTQLHKKLENGQLIIPQPQILKFPYPKEVLYMILQDHFH
ncbi:hypothetical protein PR048_018128 [Dryococelus australis]|uniref:Uncharacterized protein n=1 Tax=Dryococelus australis TaxID=614101 RepID=A0ABQ9HBD9_9NEOP|nr:hypothetical protein PR048_018128 [Dryococelus australis]